MSKKTNYRHIYTLSYPLPDYLQFAMERNNGRAPIWAFPSIADMEELSFVPLRFDNRHHVLEIFAEDTDPHVDARFKNHESLYEYVAMLQIISPYSPKHGGTDWLVFSNKNCVGILHAFEFNHEHIDYQNRRCEIGYAFAEAVRGTGLPQRAVTHLIKYLFTQLDLLYVFANVDVDNKRGIRFLEKLAFTTETSFKKEEKNWTTGRKRATICLEYFRSKQAQGRVTQYRKEATQRNAEWRVKWRDNGD
ncbi:MAG: GNAT family N-acetyltransferase [Saprospiraceae bacterium]